MLKKKLEELNIPFNIKEVISDFELNIHKAVDEILPWIFILGCLFHFANAIKKNVDKRGFKSLYDTNSEFRNFVKRVTALSSLPLDDLQEGFQVLTDIKCTDETLEDPKAVLLAYVETLGEEEMTSPTIIRYKCCDLYEIVHPYIY